MPGWKFCSETSHDVQRLLLPSGNNGDGKRNFFSACWWSPPSPVMWIVLQSLGPQENKGLSFLTRLDLLCNVGDVPCTIRQFVRGITFALGKISWGNRDAATRKCWDWLSLLFFSDTGEVLWNCVLYFLYVSPMSWHCAYVRNNVKRCPVCVWAYVPVLLAMLGCQPGSWSGLALTLWVRTKGYQSVSIKLMFKLIFFRSAKDSTKESKKELNFLILSPCSNKGVINITVYYYFQFQVPCEARGAAVLVRILFSACQLSKWSPKTVWLTFIYKRKFFIPTHTCVFLKMCLYSEKWL